MITAPEHIVKAALEVGRWFAERNAKRWELGPCASREQVTNLIAERDSLQKDAERYRWLRQQESWHPARIDHPAPFCGSVKWIGHAYSENELDDMIDYAMIDYAMKGQP